jgi:hypothetical protein
VSAVGQAQGAADRMNDGGNHVVAAKSEVEEAQRLLAAASETVSGGSGTGGDLRDRAGGLATELNDFLGKAAALQADVAEWASTLAQ